MTAKLEVYGFPIVEFMLNTFNVKKNARVILKIHYEAGFDKSSEFDKFSTFSDYLLFLNNCLTDDTIKMEVLSENGDILYTVKN